MWKDHSDTETPQMLEGAPPLYTLTHHHDRTYCQFTQPILNAGHRRVTSRAKLIIKILLPTKASDNDSIERSNSFDRAGKCVTGIKPDLVYGLLNSGVYCQVPLLPNNAEQSEDRHQHRTREHRSPNEQPHLRTVRAVGGGAVLVKGVP